MRSPLRASPDLTPSFFFDPVFLLSQSEPPTATLSPARLYIENVGVWTRTIAVIGSQPIVIGRTRAQPGNTVADRITDVQSLIAWYVTAKRTARGHIQPVTGRTPYTPPVRSETDRKSVV